LWRPARLSTSSPASLNGSSGPWWDVSNRAWNSMMDNLSTYY
jgi:hypothetical protein